ncbi:MAG: glucose 1-dehydrogenase [Bacteroidetes bacterium]|nr:MAG: glucose 1-dehydrogenase [Bacteroidota bacterium]
MKQASPQVAIVTGAGLGIGREICRQLAGAGVAVVLNDIDEACAQRAAAELGPQVVAAAGDVADPAVVQGLVDTAVAHFGRLDMAVANAGITHFGAFLSYRPEDFSRVLSVNLGGSFFLAQAAARQMMAQGSGGSLLLMSSVTGHQAHKNLAAYGMTKAALEMLARNLVLELSPHQIRVNALAPGATATERTLAESDYEQTWSRLTPLGRPASVSDIAQAALFLLSDAARHITGQTLVVDGGWTAVSPSPYEP